ncbi:major facilitator superfamily domain-containing protein [Roridomyces roridus]|uniref:Major facilitator superfamily domain-containing protein n=1 Tax=Roridomyces roridus TaxID=1738132 RepID=A0AAD7BUK7_9AGAR|nr:major facilitator superfamily domain-containing protein [Roridomyces roridus]
MLAMSDSLSIAEIQPGLPAEAILSSSPQPQGDPEKTASDEEKIEWTYPDGGRGWLVVLGCFIMACTCMGFGLVWGVFQDYYHTHGRFANTSLSTLSLVGGTFSFCMNCAAYFFGGLGERYGYKRMIALSSLLGYLCLLASAFATKLYQIFLFQGCLLGLSFGIAMPLYMSLPSQWFLRKRGLATGIAVSGAGLGGGAESLIVRALLSKLGYRNTILIFANMYAVLWVVAWFMMAERHAAGYADLKKRWLPRIRGPSFYSIALTVFFGVFGYLSPYYFITTYVKNKVPTLDPNSILVVVPLVVMNVSGGIGRILAGRLADRFGPINMLFATFFLGGLSQLILWTFAANSYGSILAFGIIYGLVGSWFISLLPVVCAELFGTDDLATITGFMVLANSPGQLSGASIAGAVYAASGWHAVSIYGGVCMLVGSFCVLYARFSYDKRIWAKV